MAKVTVEIFPSQTHLVTKVSLNIFPIRDLFKGRQGPLDGRLLQPVQKFHRASPPASRDHATAGLVGAGTEGRTHPDGQKDLAESKPRRGLCQELLSRS